MLELLVPAYHAQRSEHNEMKENDGGSGGARKSPNRSTRERPDEATNSK
jgi:hypothetical protein